jgi:hypothetical protein
VPTLGTRRIKADSLEVCMTLIEFERAFFFRGTFYRNQGAFQKVIKREGRPTIAEVNFWEQIH